MNKIYFLIFTILLFSNYLIGQENKQNKSNDFKVGINIGPNHNSLRGGSFSEKYDSNINLFTGLSFEFKINENFSILTNVNYEVKSVKTEYTTTVGFLTDFQTVEIEDKTKFQYLNIPILARMYFGFENEFFVNGGFFYNKLLDIKNEMLNKLFEAGMFFKVEDLAAFDKEGIVPKNIYYTSHIPLFIVSGEYIPGIISGFIA